MSTQFSLPKPDLSTARTVLCVQPHYDDNDIGAGGTIAALSEAGADVYYLTATDDLVGVIDDTLSPEEAARQLKAEQSQSGEVIGVRGHYWLGYPDAGPFDHFDLRRGIIKHIRLLRPDLLFTVDPWLPYEAHQDHIRVGRAAAEAAILYALMRLPSDPEVDAAYQPHELQGVVFYFTHTPNTFFDISLTREKKHRALEAYRAQFTEEDLALLHMVLDMKERQYAEGQAYTHAEALKVVHPRLLHGFPETWKM